MVPPPISGTVQRFSYTRWLTSWRTLQSLHGVGSPHWSSPTARTRASNSSTALRCSSPWSTGIGCSFLPHRRRPPPSPPTLGAGVAACLHRKLRMSLVAQGHDRLHAGRLAGRPHAEEHADGHADPEGQ